VTQSLPAPPRLGAARFDLRVATHGHGWVQLAPNRWQEGAWHTTFRLDDGTPVDARTRVTGGKRPCLETWVLSASALGDGDRRVVRSTLRRALRLDEDLVPLWDHCDATGRGWVRRRGAGRILRSPTVFEDLIKLLFTTNCSWGATCGMVRGLLEVAGTATPSGHRAFPRPAEVARLSERNLRDRVRVGYRARACRELAAGFVDGRWSEEYFEDPRCPTAELRERLLVLPGFGPYAAGQALRLLGRYDDLALDSWCRARLAAMDGRKRPPTDRSVERRYRAAGSWAGLVLWLDLTADWFDEPPFDDVTG